MTDNKRKAYVGGEILSVNGDGKLNRYDVLVVDGDKISQVGSPEILSGLGDAEVIDITGKTIVPGFTDSHLHASSMTELVFDIDIMLGQPGTMMPREEAIRAYRERISEGLKNIKPGNIVYATGWDPGIFMGTKEGFPKASELDGIADDLRVIVN